MKKTPKITTSQAISGYNTTLEMLNKLNQVNNLIWSVFETKFGDNYQLFSDLTKGILLEVYKCKVVSTIS